MCFILCFLLCRLVLAELEVERKRAEQKKREINNLYESYGADKPFPSPDRKNMKDPDFVEGEQDMRMKLFLEEEIADDLQNDKYKFSADYYDYLEKMKAGDFRGINTKGGALSWIADDVRAKADLLDSNDVLDTSDKYAKAS